MPDGSYELVDEDDLLFALQNEQISQKQYHEAYIIAHQLMIEIVENFDDIQSKVMKCYHKINQKYKKNKHNHPFKSKKVHRVKSSDKNNANYAYIINRNNNIEAFKRNVTF